MMLTRTLLERSLQENGLQGRCWGRVGSAAVHDLEAGLGRALVGDLRVFAENVGNLLVDPFNVITTGDEAGHMTCVTETRTLRIEGTDFDGGVVKIMDHAGESYLFLDESGAVETFESSCVAVGQATQRFADLASFVDWVLSEAIEFQRCIPVPRNNSIQGRTGRGDEE